MYTHTHTHTSVNTDLQSEPYWNLMLHICANMYNDLQSRGQGCCETAPGGNSYVMFAPRFHLKQTAPAPALTFTHTLLTRTRVKYFVRRSANKHGPALHSRRCTTLAKHSGFWITLKNLNGYHQPTHWHNGSYGQFTWGSYILYVC